MSDRTLAEVMRQMVDGALVDLHTVVVAQVVRVGAKTIDCQPVIARVVDGAPVQLPVFVDVPPVFTQGGASYDALPIHPGDYCLLLISERCYDDWYHGVDMAPPLDLRIHDYSDAFALVGVNPLATAITIPTERTMTGVTRMGTEEPEDFAALASLVKSEITTLRNAVNAMVTVFNAHAHAYTSPTGPAVTAVPATPQTAPSAVGDVASSYLKLPEET